MPVPEAQRLLNDLEDRLRQSPELERQLPVRPEEPLPQDCCGQSCTPCVFDIYRSELEEWSRRCWHRIKHPGEKEEDLDRAKEEKVREPVFSFQPNTYQSLKLVSIKPLTADTNVYRFALPSSDQKLFLPVGTHIIMRGWYEGKTSGKNGSMEEQPLEDPSSSAGHENAHKMKSVVRQYTPITTPDTVGFMDLMIKLYPFGKMSAHLRRVQEEMEKGKEILVEFRGPYGLFTYEANRYSDLLMLAAGTGVTPMSQIIEHILRDEDVDTTRIRLLFCCRRYEDILLKDQLDDWRRRWNFSVCYILSQWREETDRRLVKYGEEVVTGTRLDQQRITEEVQRLQRLESGRNENVSPVPVPPSPGFQVLVCGTKAFEKDMLNYLLKAGVVAKRIFRF